MIIGILEDACCKQVLVGLVTVKIVDIWVMVFLNDTFEPCTISTAIVFLRNLVLDVMHSLVKGKSFAF